MTLIGVTVTPERAWLASDTLMHEEDGRPLSVFKLLLLPASRLAMALTGPTSIALRLYEQFQLIPPPDLEQALPRAHALLLALGGPAPDEPMELVLVGWSEQRGQAEAWALDRTAPDDPATPDLIEPGSCYHRPRPLPVTAEDEAALARLVPEALEGREVAAYQLACAAMVARCGDPPAGGSLWLTEVSQAGLTCHEVGALPC